MKVEEGSGNIFEDLGFEDADRELLIAEVRRLAEKATPEQLRAAILNLNVVLPS